MSSQNNGTDAAYRNQCTKCTELQAANAALTAKLDQTKLRHKLIKVPYKLAWRGFSEGMAVIVRTGFLVLNALCFFGGAITMNIIRDGGYVLWPTLPLLYLLHTVKVVREDYVRED